MALRLLPDSFVGELDSIQMPGNWQLQSYGIPYYTDVQLPFPPDELARVPRDDNPTGNYRRNFVLPEDRRDRFG